MADIASLVNGLAAISSEIESLEQDIVRDGDDVEAMDRKARSLFGDQQAGQWLIDDLESYLHCADSATGQAREATVGLEDYIDEAQA